MCARLTRVFEADPLAAPVAPDLRAYVALAVKITARPQEVTPEDVRAAFAAAHSPRQYFDAVGVMITFNFITRVANALGVDPEIPGWMRRVEPLRRFGLRVMAFFFRRFIDLSRKEVRGPTPAEHLAALRTLFTDLRLGELPTWLERLSFAPPVLAALRELLESLARKNAATGAPGLDVNQFLAIGRTVLRTIPNAETLTGLADNWQVSATTGADAERTALVTRFASDVALHSYKITPDRIDVLRAAGLNDAEVLDVVASAALWSAAARLEVLTSCLPAQQSEARSPESEVASVKSTAAARSRQAVKTAI